MDVFLLLIIIVFGVALIFWAMTQIVDVLTKPWRTAKRVAIDPQLPPITEEMRQKETKWIWHNGQPREVCDFCGGNCGQCAMTDRLGSDIPASMEHMAKELHK